MFNNSHPTQNLISNQKADLIGWKLWHSLAEKLPAFEHGFDLYRRSHYMAIKNWLTRYSPPQEADNLAQLQGYLSSFYHLCEIAAWDAAGKVLRTPLNTNRELHTQLNLWGYYSELNQLYRRLLGKGGLLWDSFCLNGLGINTYLQGDYRQSIHYLESSLELKRQLNDRTAEGATLGNLGNCYYFMGEYERAIEYHQQSLAIAQEINDLAEQAAALTNMALANSARGCHLEAIDQFENSLTINQELGNRRGQGNALGGLGIAYYALKDYERAQAILQQQLAITEEQGDRRGQLIAVGNLGLVAQGKEEHLQAIECFHHSLAIARSMNDPLGEANALGNLGIALEQLGQDEEAENYLQSSLVILRAIEARAVEAEVLKYLAQLYAKNGDYAAARIACNQALALATSLNLPLVNEYQQLLAQLSQK